MPDLKAGYNLIRFPGPTAVHDGVAHLRGSGTGDLLQWTDAQWEKRRMAEKLNDQHADKRVR
jgi:hypothetical protein